MGKYYAVLNGRKTGIFNNWRQAEKLVKGYPGAKFKSFASLGNAEKYMEGSPYSGGENKESKGRNKNTSICIYTDGSSINNQCSKRRRAGWAAVWVKNDQFISAKKGCLYSETNNVAELEAIRQSLLWLKERRIEEPVKILTDSQYSINIFTGWLDNWKKNGYKKSDGTPVKNIDLIRETDFLLKSLDCDLSFEHVKGHSGNKFNEIADMFAKEAAQYTDEDGIL